MENTSDKILKNQLKEKFTEWSLSTTNHGIPHMFKAKNVFIRILWAAAFSASLIYCARVIVISLNDYSKWETTVSMKVVNEIPTPFPAVTICNLNPFNEERNIAELEWLRNMTMYLDCASLGTNVKEYEKCKERFRNSTFYFEDTFMIRMKRLIASEIISNEFENDPESLILGNDLEKDMLISCTFNSKKCSAKNFTRFWSNNFGFCYSFNDGKRGGGEPILYTSESGTDSGLQLELLVESAKMKRMFGYKTGLYVVVHNQTSHRYTLNDGINIPTGFEVKIGVKRELTKKAGEPYSDCLVDLNSKNPYAKRLFEFFRELNVTYYDQDFCFNLCYQDKLIERCNCSDIITPKIRRVEYCANHKETLCLDKFNEEHSIADYNKICEYACVQQCEEINYKLDLSMAKYPTLSYLKHLAQNPNLTNRFPEDEKELESFAERGMVKLIVSYDNLYYTQIDENPKMKFEGLLANIGGMLGLFLGISLISFVEVIELITDLVIIIYKHLKNTREKRASTLKSNK